MNSEVQSNSKEAALCLLPCVRCCRVCDTGSTKMMKVFKPFDYLFEVDIGSVPSMSVVIFEQYCGGNNTRHNAKPWFPGSSTKCSPPPRGRFWNPALLEACPSFSMRR